MRPVSKTGMSEKVLKLQPRLLCIAEAVPSGARLADIGTDHAYLPVWLLREGRIPYAIASDINRGPLEHARRTAEVYGVAARMDFRLCAGLDRIAPGEADTVVVAGMGGETIVSILSVAPWLREGGVVLLLQPMTKAEVLRRYLTENGFCIASERLVEDKGTIYAVLRAEAGESAPLTAAQAWCGAVSPREALYGAYAADRVRKLEEAAAGMRRGKSADMALIASMEADARALRNMIEEWKYADST